VARTALHVPGWVSRARGASGTALARAWALTRLPWLTSLTRLSSLAALAALTALTLTTAVGCGGSSTAGGGEPAARSSFTPEPPITTALPLGVASSPVEVVYVEAAAGTGPAAIPPLRKQGDLTVEHPPRKRSARSFRFRFRTHVEGSVQQGSARTWVGPPVPTWVPLAVGPVELSLLDPVRPGAPSSAQLAVYREPHGGNCSGRVNCRTAAVLFDAAGKVVWSLPVSNLLSRPDHLEVHDVAFDGATLFVNEACRASAKEAGGKCSSLVAIEPTTQKVRWRSPPLVSSGPFVLAGRYLVAAYGYYGEPAAVHVVRAADGKVVHKRALGGMPQWLELEAPLLVRVEHQRPEWSQTPGREVVQLELRGFDGESPSLVRRDPKP
jgi:hypothetical protein